jgi:hypothetical protein
MSEPDSKIDKLFGDRLRNDEFEFREEHWEKMEKLLDSESSRPAAFFSWRKYVPTVLILSALLGVPTLLFVNSLRPDKPDTRKITSENTLSPGSEENSIPSGRQPVAALPPSGSPVITEDAGSGAGGNENEGLNSETAATNAASGAVANEYNAAKSKPASNRKLFSRKAMSLAKGQSKTGQAIPTSKPTDPNEPAVKHLPFGSRPSGEKTNTVLMDKPGSRYAVISAAVSGLIIDKLPTVKIPYFTSAEDSAILRNFLPDRKHQFKIVLGENTFKAMSDDASSRKWGLSPLLGFSYQYRLSSHISISAEADYLRRNGNSLNRSTTSVTYFHYKEYTLHTLKTKSLDFIFVPVSINYKLSKRHFVTGGASGSFLFNTISDRKDIHSNYFFEQVTELKDQKGYLSGLRKLSLGLTLGYEFRTDARSLIGVRYNHSMMDITDNKLFKSGSKDLMSDFQLYIRLNAF